jgi:integrase
MEKMNMDRVNEWLSTLPSKSTRKNYEIAVKTFESFLKADVETVMNQDDVSLGHVIERYFVWLKEQEKPQNTVRTLVNGTLQFMHFYGKSPKYRKALGIFKATMSTKDRPVSIDEVRSLASVADLREQIVLETFLLGLRISDVCTLEWKQFEQDEFLLNTRKEQVVAHVYISEEFRGKLTQYLALLNKKNPFLFQSVKNEHLSEKHLSFMLSELCKRAGVAHIHWHQGRKLVYRTGLELGIPNPNMKLMLGKPVPISDGTYYEQGINLKPDADKLHKVLSLFPKPNGNGRIDNIQVALNTVMEVLRGLMEDKLREKGLMKRTKPIDWQKLYESIIPEEERRVEVEVT